MSVSLKLERQSEIAPDVPVNLDQVRAPQYGRYLDDFEPGQVFEHPRGYSLERAGMIEFARTTMQANPLYLNRDYALAHGFEDLPASPQMVFNIVLSLGVQNDSEKALANLGYYDAQFLRPVYPKDTIRAFTRVLERKDRGADKPGIVLIQTVGVNQQAEIVLQYRRKIMVAHRGDRAPTTLGATASASFPWEDEPSLELPSALSPLPTGLTGRSTYFEDFAPGDIIVHANGRTISEEHMALTYGVGNSHPLHFDRIFSGAQSGTMSGDPIVYGGLVFAWLDGLASRDVSENSIWELGFTEGYHTQPVVAGDTVAALSRVLSVQRLAAVDSVGLVTMQLLGVKNISAASALDTFGSDLFVKEDAKRKLGTEKITSKIFEIERQLLLKRRPEGA